MGITASAAGGEQKKFEKPTEMIQQAILADIVDKGIVPNPYKPGTTYHRAYFVWLLEELDSEGRNKRAYETFTVSLVKTKQGKESNLRKRVKDFGVVFGPNDKATGKELVNGSTDDLQLDSFIGIKRTLVMSLEDSTEAGGEPFLKILATQKPQGKGVDIPADFVRKQDQPAR